MNKKLLIGMLTVVGVTSTLVACGPKGHGDNGSSNKPATSEHVDSSVQTETQTNDKPNAGKKVTVEFWHTFGHDIEGEITRIAEDFHDIILEKEGVDVKISQTNQGSYTDIEKKITDGISANDLPTLAVAYPDHVAGYMAAEAKDRPGEYVVNLRHYIEDPKMGLGTQAYLGDISDEGDVYDEDDIVDAFKEESSKFANEGTYVFPFMKSTEIMLYNKDMLKKVLTSDPSKDWVAYKNGTIGAGGEAEILKFINNITWEEFMDLCTFIAENKTKLKMPDTFQPMWYDSDANFFISKMFQNNIPFTDIDTTNKKGKILFEEGTEAYNKTLEMLTTLNEYNKKGAFTTRGCNNDEYGSNHFTAMECLFTIGSSGGAGYNLPSTDEFKIGACRVPSSNNNPKFVTQGPSLTILNRKDLGIDGNELAIEYAWKFVKYITNPDINVQLCTYASQGYTPIRYSAYETTAYMKFLEEKNAVSEVAKIVSELNEFYLYTPAFKGSSKVRKHCEGLMIQMFLGAQTPKQALDKALNDCKFAII